MMRDDTIRYIWYWWVQYDVMCYMVCFVCISLQFGEQQCECCWSGGPGESPSVVSCCAAHQVDFVSEQLSYVTLFVFLFF